MSKNIDNNLNNVSPDFKGDNDKLKFENKNNFNFMLIKPNKISNMDWMDDNYLNDLLSSDFISYHESSPDQFVESIGTLLEINKYKYPDVKVKLFYEEPNYHYEILYVNLLPEYKTDDMDNEFALLLQNYGDEKIFGNVLIMKSYVPVNNMKKMLISKIKADDIIRMLYDRVNTKAITYDNGDYEEKRIFGPMDKFAKTFFEEEDLYKIQKIELPFLKHNINIWFTKFEYGDEGVCGNLLKHLRINKCIVFTLIDDNYRGNLSMDEFKKIKFLSTKLEDYLTPPDIDEDETDDIGRNVIKNRFRILELMYNKYK
jgi:hypothetical protein